MPLFFYVKISCKMKPEEKFNEIYNERRNAATSYACGIGTYTRSNIS